MEYSIQELDLAYKRLIKVKNIKTTVTSPMSPMQIIGLSESEEESNVVLATEEELNDFDRMLNLMSIDTGSLKKSLIDLEDSIPENMRISKETIRIDSVEGLSSPLKDNEMIQENSKITPKDKKSIKNSPKQKNVFDLLLENSSAKKKNRQNQIYNSENIDPNTHISEVGTEKKSVKRRYPSRNRSINRYHL